jgi:hypothetical protein
MAKIYCSNTRECTPATLVQANDLAHPVLVCHANLREVPGIDSAADQISILHWPRMLLATCPAERLTLS